VIPIPEESRIGARAWWEKRRLAYNAVLVVAGMASLTFHAALLELSNCAMEELRITPLTLVYRALGYLAAMALANLCYSLAPVVETRLTASLGCCRASFRRWSFGLGCGISFVLPFLVPLLFLAHCQ